MARLNLGGRRVTADAIEAWKAARGLDKPLFINTAAEGVQKITDTVFFERSVPLLFFDFGRSDSGRDIGYEISTRMWPSLALAVPTFLLGLIVMVAWSLLVVLFRRTRVEAAAIGLSVFLMSISSLFYIIVGQWLFSKLMRLFPISGWADGWGYTAFQISAWRPKSHILVFTSNKRILTQLNLLWGVRAYFYDKLVSTDDTIEDINTICKEKKYVKKGDMVVNLAAMPIVAKGMVNTMRVSEIE
jgi:ABC-type dipeptide/oligopeptide/nickel transport system permease component